MTQTSTQKRGTGGMASALLLGTAVAGLALPSAVLAFSSGGEQDSANTPVQVALNGEFVPAEVDPRLTRSITVRALSKGRIFRFTPAATPSRVDASVVTVAVRLNGNSLPQLSLRQPSVVPAASPAGSTLAIAPTAYSLGTARGYASFAQNSTKQAVSTPVRQLDAPDLSSLKPRAGAPSTPSRLAPRIALDEHQKTGRSPRTFEQSDQQVDLGGSYRVSRNLDVTAGVRVTSDRDRLRPLTDGRQDNQAVYVGTQFRF
ncbi:MAG: hypothetical protein WBL74_14065 [Novosphingobium sp.]|uniref:hypothetical protein n=1 Tax=Novosphingobium sp. TaxID=1874826 RepID=UPI003C7EBB48